MYDLLVIGGGASGLIAAITAKKRGKSVCILEKNDSLAKKILATGNGRCNFTNADIRPEYYHGDPDWISRVLSVSSTEADLALFRQMGLFSVEKNGYYYPYSNQAKSVLKALEDAVRALEISVEFQWNTASINPLSLGYCLTSSDDRSISGKALLLACGLIDAGGHGLETGLFPFIKELGHSLRKPLPALCGFYCSGFSFKRVAGVRQNARVSLFIDGKLAGEETGEVQFTDYGLSGIPIFQLSGPAARALDQGRRVDFSLNLISGLDRTLVEEMLQQRRNRGLAPLNGLLPDKLEKELLYQVGAEHSCKDPVQWVDLLTAFTVKADKIREFKYAQTAAGGVPVEEISPDTMESRLRKGLYFSGELIDVDGICGGYNLHWAWTTGSIVGKQV